MKLSKITLLVASALLFTSKIEAGCCGNKFLDVELRGAYFYPSNHLERRIYKDPRFDVEVELSKRVWKNLDAWVNFTYFSKNGHSIGLHDRTTLRLYPLSAGLKYVHRFCCSPWSLYAGLGVNYTWLQIHNHSHLCHNHAHKSRFGCTVKTGAYYEFTNCIFGDAFIDYLYIPMHLKNANNVGGFRFGLGLGVHI